MLRVLAALLGCFAGGCAAHAFNGSAATAGSTSPKVAELAHATIAVDSGEPDFVPWLRSSGARVEKDPNGDVRIFDSPACRHTLVQYRRMLRVRLDMIAQNLLNQNTTHDTNGRKISYRRKFVLTDKSGKTEIASDPSPFHQRYEPGHPDADSEGYVQYPNIDQPVEYANALDASMEYRMVTGILERFDPTIVPVGAIVFPCFHKGE